MVSLNQNVALATSFAFIDCIDSRDTSKMAKVVARKDIRRAMLLIHTATQVRGNLCVAFVLVYIEMRMLDRCSPYAFFY